MTRNLKIKQKIIKAIAQGMTDIEKIADSINTHPSLLLGMIRQLGEDKIILLCGCSKEDCRDPFKVSPEYLSSSKPERLQMLKRHETEIERKGEAILNATKDSIKQLLKKVELYDEGFNESGLLEVVMLLASQHTLSAISQGVQLDLLTQVVSQHLAMNLFAIDLDTQEDVDNVKHKLLELSKDVEKES